MGRRVRTALAEVMTSQGLEGGATWMKQKAWLHPQLQRQLIGSFSLFLKRLYLFCNQSKIKGLLLTFGPIRTQECVQEMNQ